MDYSCYIKVTNNLTQSLALTSSGHSHGDWDGAPPNTISGRSSTSFRLKDSFGFYGAEGYFTYTATFPLTSEAYQTSFGCPFSDNNYVRNTLSNPSVGTISYRAKSGDGSWQDNSCPTRGHPLHIEYTFDYKTVSTSASVSALTANGAYAVQNSVGTVVNYGQPVWTPSGSYNDGAYSTRPAVFASGTAGVLTVQLQLDGAMSNVPFTLTGTLAGQVLFKSGTVLGASGTQSVAVSYQPSTSGARQVYGDVAWTITVATNGQTITLPRTTRVELYWLPGRPGPMFTRGVWVTLLRILFPAVTSGAGSVTLEDQLTRYCFAPAAPYQKKYDSLSGAAHYGPNGAGGFFDISKYFGGSAATANCYDQAAVLQTSLGAFGAFTAWAFQDPYGFIKTTNLLGRGQCNNPFFLYNGSQQVVSANDPARTMFGNHAYLIAGGYVLDACQGPYPGNDDIAAYLSACIDKTTTRYAAMNPPYNRPGTEADIMSESGVTSVETVPPVAAPRAPNARLAGPLLAAAPAPDGPERFFEGPREGAFDGPLAGAGLRTTYRREVLGRDGVLVLRSLEANGVPVELRAWVSGAGAAEAEARLTEALGALQRPLTAADVRAVPELGPRALAVGPGTRHLMWVRRNVFVSLSADGDADLLPAARAVDAAVDRAPVAAEGRRLPAAPAPAVSAEVVRVGEGVEVAFPEGPAWVDYEFAGEGQLEAAVIEGVTFRFRATAPGRVVVTFLIGHPDTLAVATRSVTVTVNP